MTAASKQQCGTSSPREVASSVSIVSLFEPNPNASGRTIYNEGTATLTIHLGADQSTTRFTHVMQGGGYYEVPFGWSGLVTGVWSVASASNVGHVNEFTA